ncbi:MAG: molybdopterin-binding protein [Pseudomonadota bacterium]
MKLSARNVLPGKIKQIRKGPISTEVVLEVAGGVEIVSVITTGSADNLGLKEGEAAYAVFKADSVMVGVDR